MFFTDTCVSRRVSPPATAAPAETDRFSPSFERRRGMKPLSQPTTLVDVFPCTRGCVPDSLFSFSLSLSLHLFISLPLRLSLCLFSLLPSFRLSARAKEWPRRGYGGAKSGTNIFDCSCVRECEWRRVCENLVFPILKGSL